jgi:hypothetical protein
MTGKQTFQFDLCSAERESVGINSRIQEFNCERAVTYRIVLSAYLFKVQPGNAQILFSGNPIGASLFNPLSWRRRINAVY